MLKSIIVKGKISECYFADKEGNIYNKEGHKMTTFKSYGYLRVKLSRDIPRGMYLVHRIIAETFLDNPQNLPIVLHLNDVRDDCRVENLKWGTNSENQLARFKTNPPTKTSPVAQIDLETGEIVAKYDTIKEAQKKTGIRNKAGNYLWKYLERESVETIREE